MASLKKTIRLNDETIKACVGISPQSGSVNFAYSINTIAKQFMILIEDNTPKLPENVWNAFYCAYNGHFPLPNIIDEAANLHWHISEGYQYDDQIKDFIDNDENLSELIEKINSWSISEKIAVIFKAQSYWRNQNTSEISDNEQEELINIMNPASDLNRS